MGKQKKAPETPATQGLSRRDFFKQAATGASALAFLSFADKLPTLARPASQDVVNIRAMIIQPERVDAFNKIMPLFQESHPNVNVEFVGVAAAEWSEFLQKVAVMIASGQQLDNLEVANEGFQLFASNNIMRKLDDIVMTDPDMPDFFSDVNPVMIESQMYQGSLYNLPFLWAAAGINYNKSLFDKAGLDYPTDDWTVEDFTAAAKAISALGEDIVGYAWPNRSWGGYTPWSYVNDTSLIEMTHAEGGDWLWNQFYPELDPAVRSRIGGGIEYGAPQANDPNNVEALQYLQDLAFQEEASYMVGPGGLPDLWAAFTTGKLGMMVAHRAWISRFNGAGMSPDEYDVVYHPMWKTQKSQFGASGLAVTTISQHPDEAFALLKHLTSRETQAAFIAGGVHTASRRSVTNAPDQNEGIAPSNWQAYYGMLDDIPTQPVPAPPQGNAYINVVTKWLGLAMANEMTAQEALDGMQEELIPVLSS